MTLYDIQGDYLRLYELAATMEDVEAFSDTLEGLNGDLEVKSKGCIEVIKQLDMEAKECDEVIERFKAKKQARENAIKRLKTAIYDTMNIAGITEIKAGDYTIKVVKNGGKEPLVIDGEVPEAFYKMKYEVDESLIRKAIENGEEIGFAHLEPRGTHLQIR